MFLKGASAGQSRMRWQMMLLIVPILLFLGMAKAHAAELVLQAAAPFAEERAQVSMPGQLPLSRVAYGGQDIRAAWLAGPTDRYRHGVLGDDLEASRLMVETSAGKQLQFELPAKRVFEDLQPRLADLDGDLRDEIIVVESDQSQGASLAVYGIHEDRLIKRSATPFLGRTNRWLNPLGVGDFDGDGKLDIALVATPHIGGILRLYHFAETSLIKFAELAGVSTHSIGSTELGLGRVVSASPRDQFLVPDQAHKALMLLEWTEQQWRVSAKLELPTALASSLMTAGDDRWRFRLVDGSEFEVRLER